MNTKINLFQNSTNSIEFKAGDMILQQGECGDTMYIIAEGRVEIDRNGVYIDTLEAGQIFGEIAVLESIERVASATAKTDCRLIPIDAKTFLYLIDHNRSFVLDVMRVLAERSTTLQQME